MTAPARIATEDRRQRILDAFERCLARSGFHSTTMNDVAAEAEMSPGNLYRYFPSKGAIVEGLCHRDREEIARAFAEVEAADDLYEALCRVGRRHFVEEARERMVMVVEIWAEATRNPEIAAIHLTMEREINRRMTQLFERAKARGEVAPEVDSGFVTRLFTSLADAFFLRRALLADFDAAQAFDELMATIRSAMRGELAPARTAPTADALQTAAEGGR